MYRFCSFDRNREITLWELKNSATGFLDYASLPLE